MSYWVYEYIMWDMKPTYYHDNINLEILDFNNGTEVIKEMVPAPNNNTADKGGGGNVNYVKFSLLDCRIYLIC